jgi:uncharacterized protein
MLHHFFIFPIFMKKSFLLRHIFVFILSLTSAVVLAQTTEVNFVKENYTKYEHQITMRDGIKLFTIVYVPKDASETNKYPILMQRTCYDVAPYGPDNYAKSLYSSPHMMREKYIFVEQDVRGRYMSEGLFTNMTPHIPNKVMKKDIDEASDTYDTIDWLVKNIKHNNGRVGQYGTSYPGFYTVAGALCGHPALKASSPQAPVSDFYFDDFHHNGAFTVGYGNTFPVFGVQKTQNTPMAWYGSQFPKKDTKDGFDWYRKMTPLSAFNGPYKDNFFWNEIVEHPNYDEFWQKRNILPHLKNLTNAPAIMTVGGWFDAEDLYGPLNIYKTLEKNNPKLYNTLVMGPFGHGDWAREQGHHMHSNIYFGDSVATFFQKNIEIKFFNHFLKGDGKDKLDLPEAYLFDTGKKEWQTFAQWPAQNAEKQLFYMLPQGKLGTKSPTDFNSFTDYVSDPNKPVPYTEDNKQLMAFTPRAYMSEDQRFAGRRPDVLVFETEVLENDITLGGEITAKLKIATTGTDADFFVKLIDVYPGDTDNSAYTPKGVLLAGYQQMVRSEIMRARFRESFEKPQPLVSNQVTDLTFRLQDVLHTFKKGHKIMVQVQSTAYPLFDVNPQKYVDNIYKAQSSDFVKAIHRVYHSIDSASALEVQVLK